MNVKVIDNFLNDYEINKIIQNTIKNENFSLYMKDGTSYTSEEKLLYANDGVYFTHNFFKDDSINSEAYFLLEPVLKKINPQRLLRIQLNLYPKTFFKRNHGWHTDFNFPHKGCILYLNTNNGKTVLKNGFLNIGIKSVKNRVLFFDPHLNHRSTTCTDKEFRSNIIFNYLH